MTPNYSWTSSNELKPPERAWLKWEEAVRLMIYDCWSDLGGGEALPLMQNRLGQTWSGHVLGRIIAHEEARRRARQEHEACSNPVRLRRDECSGSRSERRLLQKKERDRLWWAIQLAAFGNN
jgi:hypothetical protein